MDYKKKSGKNTSLINTEATSGATSMKATDETAFFPWQPSTWPLPPEKFNQDFEKIFGRIVRETIIAELQNVISDIKKSNGDLAHRGHVVGIALICGLEVVSSYAYADQEDSFKKFMITFFPDDYKKYADKFYKEFRNDLVHQWNLFLAGIQPGEETISDEGGILRFGLQNFLDAFTLATDAYLNALSSSPCLQYNCLDRYRRLRRRARAAND